MSGSQIFVIYTDSTGTNITLSPRLGTGHSMPNYNSAAQVELLEGSGVSNGVMTANIKCEDNDKSNAAAATDYTLQAQAAVHGVVGLWTCHLPPPRGYTHTKQEAVSPRIALPQRSLNTTITLTPPSNSARTRKVELIQIHSCRQVPILAPMLAAPPQRHPLKRYNPLPPHPLQAALQLAKRLPRRLPRRRAMALTARMATTIMVTATMAKLSTHTNHVPIKSAA